MTSPNPPPLIPSGTTPTPSVRYLPTTTAYDLWASVYDTDGNFLQALDSIEMKILLPRALSLIQNTQQWKLVDLGCGTGRNTAALLTVPNAKVVGLDASQGMLDVARGRLAEDRLQLAVYDLLATASPPVIATKADAVISTLVIEHIPISTFFSAAVAILKVDGVFLVTNMHAEMGGMSQAGFVDPKTGEKIRPTSYAHSVEDVVAEATRCGFEIVSQVDERRVDEEMLEVLGKRARKWVGVMVWFGAIFRRVR